MSVSVCVWVCECVCGGVSVCVCVCEGVYVSSLRSSHAIPADNTPAMASEKKNVSS